MFSRAFNIAKARRWQEKRARIRASSGTERLRLLQSFGEELRAVAPVFDRSPAVAMQDVADALRTSPAFGAVFAAWLDFDPANPQWPGRDRLFVTNRSDLVAACAALSACGFFPPEAAPSLVEGVDAGGWKAVVPGVEFPGAPGEEIPRLAWESATGSARDKRRWREACGTGSSGAGWASPAWRDAPETWRTCVTLRAGDPVADGCRDLALRADESAAGLVALVRAPEDAAAGVAGEWRSAGWEAVSVSGGDAGAVLDALAGSRTAKPSAVVLGEPGGPELPRGVSRTSVRRREAELLGRMSDEQFSALLGESLKM